MAIASPQDGQNGKLWQALESLDPNPPVDPRAPLPALETELVGRFRVQAFLGGGGMGLVYEGLDLESGQPVAIKTPRPGCTRPELLHFIREASLEVPQHPCLVQTLARFVQERRPYQIQERVPGRSLQEILMARMEEQDALHPSEKPWFTGDEVLRVAVQAVADLARGLDVLHRAGVVHRDLKPSNLVWHEEGRAVLVDYGLAYQESGRSLTRAEHVAGTAAYMAPEQWEEAAVDARADVYALGATLWHLLTGEVPARMPRSGRLMGHRQPIPSDLVAVVQKALELRPKFRFQSASEFARALDGWLGLRPPFSGLQRKRVKFRRMVYHYRWPLALACGLSVCASMLILGARFIDSNAARREALFGQAAAAEELLETLSSGEAQQMETSLDRLLDAFLALAREDPEAEHPDSRRRFRQGTDFALRTGRFEAAKALVRPLEQWQTLGDAAREASVYAAGGQYAFASRTLRRAAQRWPEDSRLTRAADFFDRLQGVQVFALDGLRPLIGSGRVPGGLVLVNPDGQLQQVQLTPSGEVHRIPLSAEGVIPPGSMDLAAEIRRNGEVFGYLVALRTPPDQAETLASGWYFLSPGSNRLQAVLRFWQHDRIVASRAVDCADLDGDGMEELVFGFSGGRRRLVLLDFQGGLWHHRILPSGQNSVSTVHLVPDQDHYQLWVALEGWNLQRQGYRLHVYRLSDGGRRVDPVESLLIGAVNQWQPLRGWHGYHSVASCWPISDAVTFGKEFASVRSGDVWLIGADQQAGLFPKKALFQYPQIQKEPERGVYFRVVDVENDGVDELVLHWHWQQESFSSIFFGGWIRQEWKVLELPLHPSIPYLRDLHADANAESDLAWLDDDGFFHVVFDDSYAEKDPRATAGSDSPVVLKDPEPAAAAVQDASYRNLVLARGQEGGLEGEFPLPDPEFWVPGMVLWQSRFRVQVSDLHASAFLQIRDPEDHKILDFQFRSTGGGTSYCHCNLASGFRPDGKALFREHLPFIPGVWVRLTLQSGDRPDRLVWIVEPESGLSPSGDQKELVLEIDRRHVGEYRWTLKPDGNDGITEARDIGALLSLDWIGPGRNRENAVGYQMEEAVEFHLRMESERSRGDLDGWKVHREVLAKLGAGHRETLAKNRSSNHVAQHFVDALGELGLILHEDSHPNCDLERDF